MYVRREELWELIKRIEKLEKKVSELYSAVFGVRTEVKKIEVIK